MRPAREGTEMPRVGPGWRPDLIRLELMGPAYLWEGPGTPQTNTGPVRFLEFRGALPRGPPALLKWEGDSLVAMCALDLIRMLLMWGCCPSLSFSGLDF